MDLWEKWEAAALGAASGFQRLGMCEAPARKDDTIGI